MDAEPATRPAGDPPATSHGCARAATVLWLGAWLLLTATARWTAPPIAEIATRIEIAAGWTDVIGGAAPQEEAVR